MNAERPQRQQRSASGRLPCLALSTFVLGIRAEGSSPLVRPSRRWRPGRAGRSLTGSSATWPAPRLLSSSSSSSSAEPRYSPATTSARWLCFATDHNRGGRAQLDHLLRRESCRVVGIAVFVIVAGPTDTWPRSSKTWVILSPASASLDGSRPAERWSTGRLSTIAAVSSRPTQSEERLQRRRGRRCSQQA
jgi:hypothetical protein